MSDGERDLGPWRLLPHRVPRFYRGGLLLDAFRGAPDPADTNEPEDWVGSATPAWTPPGRRAGQTGEGLSDAELRDGRRRVADVLAADPVGVAGPALARLASTGLLVKLLDAAIRLPVHAHPTRDFARTHLASAFGKAEAWIVLGTRQIAGEPPPHVRLGFRASSAGAVSRDQLRGWIEGPSSEALLDALHVRETQPGDVWFVPAGTPHAIGAGVFILEVQEPTDFSIVAETSGFPIDREQAHLGLGWDVTLDAIDRRGLADPELVALRGADRRPGTQGSAWQRDALLPPAADPFFRADRVRVDGSAAATPFDEPSFAVAVVVAGSGEARVGGRGLQVGRGDAFAVPHAGLTALELAADGALELIVCRPGTMPPEPLP